MSGDDPLSYLLDLDGEILVQEVGYCVKIEAIPARPRRRIRMGSAIRWQGLLCAARRVRPLAPDGYTIEAYEFTDAG